MNSHSQKNMQIMFMGMAAIGGLTAFLVYINQKEKRKLDEENAKLDREIKHLDLALKKKKVSQEGIKIKDAN